MNIKGIAAAMGSDLSTLGITAKGDIIALRAFCAKSEAPTKNVEKKKQLLQAVKKSSRIAKDEPKKVKNRNFVILVLGYIVQAKKSMYIGGMVAPNSIGLQQMQTIDNIFNFGKSKLFVDGNHGKLGRMTRYTFKLGTSDGKELLPAVNVDGIMEDFTLQGYMKQYCFTRYMFYVIQEHKGYISKY